MGFISRALLDALNRGSIEDQLEAALKNLRSGRKKSLSTQRNELTAAYRTEKLVFVLGAGVSLDYGLPAWSVLLQELLIRTLGNQKPDEEDQSGQLAKAYTDFFRPSPLMAARYTRLKLKEGFIDSVREVLYARVNDDKDSALMEEIRKFAVAAGRAPNLDSIITFNFDDLLERCIDRVKNSDKLPGYRRRQNTSKCWFAPDLPRAWLPSTRCFAGVPSGYHTERGRLPHPLY